MRWLGADTPEGHALSRYRPVRSRYATPLYASILALVAIPAPLAAQDVPTPPRTAETVVREAEAAYGPPPPQPKCERSSGDEIVVCAEKQEQSQFRVQPTSELDPESDQALNDGVPRAPDVAGPGIFHGKPTFTMGEPPPPALIVDVTALPQAPPGSDADRIARGLAPRGDDAGKGMAGGTGDDGNGEEDE